MHIFGAFIHALPFCYSDHPPYVLEVRIHHECIATFLGFIVFMFLLLEYESCNQVVTITELESNSVMS
jgi:hypothetical protein